MKLINTAPIGFKFKDPKTGKKFTLGSNGDHTDYSEFANDSFNKLRKSPVFKAAVAAGVIYVSYKTVIFILNESAELVRAAKKLEKAINS